MSNQDATAQLAPTPAAERIFALDMLRGFAVLGILFMNILGFGLPRPGYVVPSAEVGGIDGWNLWAWIVEMFYFEGTMRGLFTLLFGAGVVLYTSRLEKAGLGVRVADYYFRRNLWLIVFGLVNAYVLLWRGDILYAYGLTALFLFVFRLLPIKALLLWSAFFLCVNPVVANFDYRNFLRVEAEAPALQAAKAAKQDLTDEQLADLAYYENRLDMVRANPEKAHLAIAKMTASYASAAATVAPRNWSNQTSGFFEVDLWECLGMMLLGMALFKSGALNLGWSTRAYVILLVTGYGIGLTVNALEIRHVISQDFAPSAVMVPWFVTYDLGRIPTTLGHIALAMLLVRSGWFRGLLGAFSAAGQMALTNYLSQSLICMFLFTGAGLGWFGSLQRHELYYVVASIWAVQLLWSPWWLRRFQYGPMEWLWRSLTRWQTQPMRKRAAAP